MEDWIAYIKGKLLADRPELPPGDWERFEAGYLASRRKRRLLLPAVATVFAAAAAVAVLFLLDRPTSLVVPAVEPIAASAVVAEVTEPEISVEEDAPAQVDRRAAVFGKTIPVVPEEVAPVAAPDAAIELEPDVPVVSERAENEPESTDVTSSRVKEASARDTAVDLVDLINHPDNPHRWLLSLAPYFKGFRSRENAPISLSEIPGHTGYSSASSETPDANHMIPLSLGLDVSISVAPRLELTSGIDLSLYRSRPFVSAGASKNVQNAYYLGIPLRLDWTLWNQGRFSAWLGAGGKADYLIYGKWGSERLKDDTIHWSVVGDVGLQYCLSPNIGLFLQPEISYYFKPAAPAIQTYRTGHPLVFSVGAGLRFTL